MTKDFKLDEFLVSKHYPDVADKLKPTKMVRDNLLMLCLYIMQPVRDNFNRAMIITSGYRDERLNPLVSHSSASKHMLGRACDFVIHDRMLLNSVYKYIKNTIEYSELILYIDRYNKPINIHVALPEYGDKKYSEVVSGK